jgi:hypothetical protein
MDHPGLGRTTESRWTKELERNGNSQHSHTYVSKLKLKRGRGRREKGNFPEKREGKNPYHFLKILICAIST